MNKLSAAVLLCFFILAGCGEQSVKVSPLENINKGALKLGTDASLEGISAQLAEVYVNMYPEASIVPVLCPGEQLLQNSESDSIRVFLMGRMLRNDEKKWLKQKYGKEPIEHVFGYDGVAFLVSLQAPGEIDFEWLNRGIEEAWEGKGKLKLVLDHPASSLLSYRFEKAPASNNPQLYAVQGAEAVAAYVRQHPDWIGLVSFSTLSNAQDQLARKLMEGNQLLSLKNGDRKIVLSQSAMADSSWPYVRPINYVIANSPERVANGYANFLHRGKAAKVLLRAGLLPKIMPERQFNLGEEGFRIR